MLLTSPAMSGQAATLNTWQCSYSQMLTLTAPWGPQQQAQQLFLEQHRWAQFPYPEAWHQPLSLWPQAWRQPLAAPAHRQSLRVWVQDRHLPETETCLVAGRWQSHGQITDHTGNT